MFPRTTRAGLRARAALAAGTAALLATVALLSGCSSGKSSAAGGAGGASGPGTAAERNPNVDPGSSLGNAPAADFRLTNQFGQPMSLSQFRGKVVLLAFTDSRCTTVCPLTTESMLLAKELLGKAGRQVQLLGIDANPDARSVSDVMAYSRAHGMVNQWDFLTGSLPRLRSAWKGYHIAVQIQKGQIDHTPALYAIDAQGKLRKVYLTQMSYDSIGQSAQVLARELSSLLPSHPKLLSQRSMATITPRGPSSPVTLASAAGGPAVSLGPGKPRLVVFFATWVRETSDLAGELKSLNSYTSYAAARRLPAVTAVDETVTEPSARAVRSYLSSVGRLNYPVGLDSSGRVADGYHVQDQPWLALVNAAGKITWSHDGWVPLPALEKAAAVHP
ncbi:MAG: SCO family protein [Nocardiopsaceae bacterium]|nr:SCO family protein [Nocardiopsaceae bacterium]